MSGGKSLRAFDNSPEVERSWCSTLVLGSGVWCVDKRGSILGTTTSQIMEHQPKGNVS